MYKLYSHKAGYQYLNMFTDRTVLFMVKLM